MSDNVSHIFGLDIGKSADPSALCVVERKVMPANAFYDVRHMTRWKLGTPYTAKPGSGTPNVVDDVLGMLDAPGIIRPTLVVDATGVGAAVVDALRWQVRCVFKPVVITGGENARRDAKTGSLHVPKKDLAGVLQALFGTRRLQIAAGLAELETLKKELAAFKTRITRNANEQFEAMGTGNHDDLVLALAMALWVGENAFGGDIDNAVAAEQGRGVLADVPPGVWETDQTGGEYRSIYEPRGD